MSEPKSCPVCKSEHWYIQYVIGHGKVRPIFCPHPFHDRRGRSWPSKS